MNTSVTPEERPAGNASPGRAAAAWQAVPGLSAAVVVAIVATGLGRLLPIVGGPVIAIALGLVAGSALGHGTDRRRRLDRGAAIAAGPVLQLSVVLLGTGLSLSQVVRTGTSSLPVMLGTLAVALLGARVIGRVLRLTGDTTTLIGVGTGICGASAIAAVTAVIGAAEADVAYAIATIFTFNIAAVLLYPALGHLLGLSQHAFGLWAGTAVNDTSSVVAAARSYGSAAANYAVVVKLTRSLMIIPICVALGVRTARRSGVVMPAAVPTGPARGADRTTRGAAAAALAADVPAVPLRVPCRQRRQYRRRRPRLLALRPPHRQRLPDHRRPRRHRPRPPDRPRYVRPASDRSFSAPRCGRPSASPACCCNSPPETCERAPILSTPTRSRGGPRRPVPFDQSEIPTPQRAASRRERADHLPVMSLLIT